jgi:hypothetical protein
MQPLRTEDVSISCRRFFEFLREVLQSAGSEILTTDFLFIFPRAFRWPQFLEMLGGEYMVPCRKPD